MIEKANNLFVKYGSNKFKSINRIHTKTYLIENYILIIYKYVRNDLLFSKILIDTLEVNTL